MKNQLDINFVRSQFPAFQNEKTQNGKGDKNRVSNKKQYDKNYDRIFKKLHRRRNDANW